MFVQSNGVRVMSGGRYELHIPNRVRFTYKDEKIPLSHRFVLYWQYNKAADGFNMIDGYHNYWRDNDKHMPIGLGQTDKDGYLLPASQPPGLTVSASAYDKHPDPNDRSVSYKRPNMANKQIRDNVVDLLTSDKYSTIRTVSHFGPNDVAFMLLPVDNPNLDTWQSKDLIELGKNSPMVVKTSVTEDGQEVQLPCSLSEWDRRLQKQNSHLEESITRYHKIIAPHLAEIAKLENIRHFQQIHYRYPLHKSQRDEAGSKAIIDNIKNLQKAISDEYVTKTDKSTPCGLTLSEVIEQGEQLMELLNSPALRAELKRYFSYLAESTPKTSGQNQQDKENIVSGPDTQQESDWRKIYETLVNSYGMLATTPDVLSSRVFNEHVDPMLDYILTLSDELQAKDGIEEVFARDYNRAIGKTTSTDTLPVFVLSEWLKNSYGHVANSPGPPSLGIAIINAYGVFIAGKFDPIINKKEAAKSFRLLTGLLTMLNWGDDIGFKVKRDLYEALRSKDLAAGNKKISGYLDSLPVHKHMKYLTPALKVAMFIYAIFIFQYTWQVDTINTWYEWSKILTSGADLGMAGMGTAAYAVRFFNLSWAGVFSVGVEMAGRVLGVVAGLATMVSSRISAINRKNRGDVFGSNVANITSAASAAVTVAYILGYIVIGMSAPFAIGLVVAAIGISLFEPVFLYVRSHNRESSQRTFYTMFDGFENKPDGQYRRIYSNNQVVVNALGNVTRAAYKLQWWSMSWRAIVPLYESGLIEYKGNNQVNLRTSASFIAQAIYVPKPKTKSRVERRRFTNTKFVMKYLNQYERIKRDESKHISTCGNSTHDWLQGIALPFQQPSPIYEDAL